MWVGEVELIIGINHLEPGAILRGGSRCDIAVTAT
jgi:hypothetical protein